jgi:3'-phosphoadenosine 5'-phosphosulfate (PAPS) 3'-phosphatase
VRAGGLSVESKADNSPVTEADRAAERAIDARLAEVAPGVPVIGEEAVSEGRIPETGSKPKRSSSCARWRRPSSGR